MIYDKTKIKNDITMVAFPNAKLYYDYEEEELKFLEKISRQWEKAQNDNHAETLLECGANEFIERFHKERRQLNKKAS